MAEPYADVPVSAMRRVFAATRKVEGRLRPRLNTEGIGLREDVFSVDAYAVQGVFADHLTVVPLKSDGTADLTAATIKVAKPFMLRATPFNGLTILGNTYSYPTGTQRTVTAGSTSETQKIVPSYQELYSNPIIYVASCPEVLGISQTGITLIDLNVDGRAWAKV